MAGVDFTMQEWSAFVSDARREDVPLKEVRRMYEAMQDMTNYGQVRHRRRHETLERLNTFLDGFGVAGLFERDGELVTDGTENHLIDYIDFGETYARTLIYDVDRHAFYLGDYGSFVEAWQAEHPEEVPCELCGEMTADFDADTGLCPDCRDREHESDREREREEAKWASRIWKPLEEEQLIAVLRSVEGAPVHVHAVHGDPQLLGFSVPSPIDGYFFAEEPDRPYVLTLAELRERFEYNHDTIVTLVCEQNITIEESQYQRLMVALDAFLEGAGVQTQKAFLTAPPVLWTCGELDIRWHEERGEATIDATVTQRSDRGNQEYDLWVWRATSPEVEQLIEDGFVKWKNDASVRKYLADHGYCRPA